MEIPTSTDQGNKQTILWIVVILVVLCLCCLVLSAGVGLWYYLDNRSQGVGILSPRAAPSEATSAAPPEEPSAAPSATPAAAWQAVTIDSIKSASDLDVPSIYSLVPDYVGQTSPGSAKWEAQVSKDDRILVFMGWCTLTKDILEKNMQDITYTVVADDRNVNISIFQESDSPREGGGYCRDFSAIINRWTVGEHVIQITMHIERILNDGWGDYAAGDYQDIFVITVVQ